MRASARGEEGGERPALSDVLRRQTSDGTKRDEDLRTVAVVDRPVSKRYVCAGIAKEGFEMRERQIAHVGADVVIAQRRGSRRAAGQRAAGGTNPLARFRFVTGMVLIVALATAGFGVAAYTRVSRDQTRIVGLQSQVMGLEQRLAADEHGAASDRRHVRSVAAQASSARRALQRFSWALQSVPSEAQVAVVRNQLAAYAACIPQLQSEIAGLGISWRIDPTKPAADYFRLATATPMSTSCFRALSGR
jgi:hypothetical protein